ncbi:hypothetical protein JXA32_03705 [Candidatus Sumerlaeota bacterium]|nr:hypothetical protein [Candidatus Sumerlaeota bacterium]
MQVEQDPDIEHWIESLIGKAHERHVENSSRAYAHCMGRFRPVQRFTHRGFQVFMFRTREQDAIESALSCASDDSNDADQTGPFQLRRGARPLHGESDLSQQWRMANAISRAGLDALHTAAAYARKRWHSRIECLVCDSLSEQRRFMEVLHQSGQRREALCVAGDTLRRLHEVRINLTRLRPDEWRVQLSSAGELQLRSSDLAAFVFMEQQPIERSFDWLIAWLKSESDLTLSRFDLGRFLRVYFRGPIDRAVWRAVISAAPVSPAREFTNL